MNYDDWQALSGVGPRLAERIEVDRQQNGDFGSLDGLKRVRGIGPRSIEGWRNFF
jgi:competence protein ComEA